MPVPGNLWLGTASGRTGASTVMFSSRTAIQLEGKKESFHMGILLLHWIQPH